MSDCKPAANDALQECGRSPAEYHMRDPNMMHTGGTCRWSGCDASRNAECNGWYGGYKCTCKDDKLCVSGGKCFQCPSEPCKSEKRPVEEICKGEIAYLHELDLKLSKMHQEAAVKFKAEHNMEYEAPIC